MNEDDVFGGVGVEISLAKPDDFLKVKETLTRIGVSAKKDNILYQSCHILHKRGRYAIVHFKELFILDGKSSDIVENDYARRNTIVNLLAEWKLVSIIDPPKATSPAPAPINQIKIIPHKDKHLYQLVPKYTIGSKKKVSPNT